MVQNLQENNSINATLTTTFNGQETPVINIVANLNSGLTGISMNINFLNADVIKTNQDDVQKQLTDFMTNTIKPKMTALGYPVTV